MAAKQDPVLAHQLAYLGAAILLQDGAKASLLRLMPAMFAPGGPQEIYTAMRSLAQEGAAIDALTVARRAGEEHRALIVRAAETCPSISHLEDYETLIVEDHRVALLQATALQLTQAGATSDALCTMLRSALAVQDALAAAQRDASAQEFDAVLDRTLAQLQKPDTSLKTAWEPVDRFGMLERGNTVVLAGRPGCGKTDFAINLAARLSCRYRVYYLTLEEADTKLMSRILSKVCRIDAADLRDKRLRTDQMGALRNAAAALRRHRNMVIESGDALTVEGVRTRVLRHKPDVLFLDHIGLMSGSDPRAKEYDRLSEITRGLKILAKEMGIVVVELCQLSRQSARSGNAYATLADLRGSGTIEQDANACLMMRNQPPGGPVLCGEDYRQSGVLIVKNRDGGLGEIAMQWRPQYHDWLPEDAVAPLDEGGEAGQLYME